MILINEGTVNRPALDANGLALEAIAQAARLSHGLADTENVRQATLERDGHISIVPWRHDTR